jgi:hypothetical protein
MRIFFKDYKIFWRHFQRNWGFNQRLRGFLNKFLMKLRLFQCYVRLLSRCLCGLYKSWCSGGFLVSVRPWLHHIAIAIFAINGLLESWNLAINFEYISQKVLQSTGNWFSREAWMSNRFFFLNILICVVGRRKIQKQKKFK